MRHRRQGNADGLTDVVFSSSSFLGARRAEAPWRVLRVTSDGGLVFVVKAEVMKRLRKRSLRNRTRLRVFVLANASGTPAPGRFLQPLYDMASLACTYIRLVLGR